MATILWQGFPGANYQSNAYLINSAKNKPIGDFEAKYPEPFEFVFHGGWNFIKRLLTSNTYQPWVDSYIVDGYRRTKKDEMLVVVVCCFITGYITPNQMVDTVANTATIFYTVYNGQVKYFVSFTQTSIFNSTQTNITPRLIELVQNTPVGIFDQIAYASTTLNYPIDVTGSPTLQLAIRGPIYTVPNTKMYAGIVESPNKVSGTIIPQSIPTIGKQGIKEGKVWWKLVSPTQTLTSLDNMNEGKISDFAGAEISLSILGFEKGVDGFVDSLDYFFNPSILGIYVFQTQDITPTSTNNMTVKFNPANYYASFSQLDVITTNTAQIVIDQQYVIGRTRVPIDAELTELKSNANGKYEQLPPIPRSITFQTRFAGPPITLPLLKRRFKSFFVSIITPSNDLPLPMINGDLLIEMCFVDPNIDLERVAIYNY